MIYGSLVSKGWSGWYLWSILLYLQCAWGTLLILYCNHLRINGSIVSNYGGSAFVFYFNCLEFSVQCGLTLVNWKVIWCRTMGIAGTAMFSSKISWAMVSCVGLAFEREKSKLKVEILRHSKPNLTALFERQSRNCWYCWKLLLKISLF